MIGKVWLVGAGPGDVGLMTLKGRDALARADVVVYDALVGAGVLGLIPETARRIFAGKRAGNHFLRQEQTNRVLLEEALAGNRVVRLKGGDPFLFGRGGEELELLIEHGVPFEIVPGVTSAFAVPAYCGIPVTHRDYCSSVHVITGHRRSGAGYDIDFGALARAGGTLIFLMGRAALPDICGGLLGAGMDGNTPAAVLEKGATAAQRRIGATLSTLQDACEKANVGTPAIIVVGRVCELAERFAWREKLPLSGVKALITRPRELSSGMAALLRERGAEVVELPAIRTVPVADDGLITAAIDRLARGGFDWVVFTSPSGVRIFMDRLLEARDIRALAGARLAAIGEGSRKALMQYGLRCDFVPSVYDGETLGRELAAICEPGARLLIPRAAIGNRELVDELAKGRDLEVADIATYDTEYAVPPGSEGDMDGVDFAVFTSASTVRGFAAGMPGLDMTRVKAVCIGRQTQRAAESLGMRTWVAGQATLKSLADAVEAAAEETKKEVLPCAESHTAWASAPATRS